MQLWDLVVTPNNKMQLWNGPKQGKPNSCQLLGVPNDGTLRIGVRASVFNVLHEAATCSARGTRSSLYRGFGERRRWLFGILVGVLMCFRCSFSYTADDAGFPLNAFRNDCVNSADAGDAANCRNSPHTG
mmetsp:Transcript_21767/g.41551  ORF Transcript_21767/g.41551 Transcript_21767/m.41551 type:complete len:130 (+) Transcript_21767:54-443(+)